MKPKIPPVSLKTGRGSGEFAPRQIDLRIEKPVYGGDGLAHVEGKAVFVPLTLPGETVSARVTEEKRSFAKAELERVLTASPHRIEPPCPYFGACGGCHYQHADYPTQLAFKQQILRETLTRAGVQLPAETGVLSDNPWAYRNRIRLGMLPGGAFGYRARRSHDLVAIDTCLIAAPVLITAAKNIAAFLGENPPSAPVLELELFTNSDESEVLATLFCERAPADDSELWLAKAYDALKPHITGIRLQLQDGALELAVIASAGQSSLSHGVAGMKYQVGHGAFFQVNRWLLDEFASFVTGGDSGQLAWDLYSGVGLFASRLRNRFREVIAVEAAPTAWPSLESNMKSGMADSVSETATNQATAAAIRSNTLDFLRRNRDERRPRPDFIVLDPPRAGLGAETTTLLNQIHAPEMVYVSCDPATLARDLSALTAERYEIASLTLADMFPQTFHLETIVRLHAR